MDLVFNTGDELYGHLSNSSTINTDYLLVNCRCELILFDKSYTMIYHESVTGMLEDDGNLSEFNMVRLDEALEEKLQRYGACFICFNGNTFGVIAQNGVFYIFDSHSRNCNGCRVQDGKSLMKCAVSWQDVYRYCTQLGHSMNLSNNEQFEITGVTICQDNDACASVNEDCNHRDNVYDAFNLSSICNLEEDNRNKESKEKIDEDFSCEYSNDLSDSGEHVQDNKSETEIVMEVVNESSTFKFNPLTFEHQKSLCKSLGIGKVKPASKILMESVHIGEPNEIRTITGDGNCFFRSVSYAISGTERYHMRLRMAIVNQLLKDARYYKTYLRQGHRDVEDYVQSQRMFNSGIWATEIEIMACAHFLATDIYTFSNTGRWYIFSGQMTGIGTVTSNAGIYLNHASGIHYDVVLSVYMLPMETSHNGEQIIDLDESSVCDEAHEETGACINENIDEDTLRLA